MGTITPEQFILCCINNSDLTTINFEDVADECGDAVPTKGAASKRYSRWKLKIAAELGQGPGAASNGEDQAADGEATPKKGKKSSVKTAIAAEGGRSPKKTTKAPVKKTPAKKRKLEDVKDEGEEANVKGEPDDEV